MSSKDERPRMLRRILRFWPILLLATIALLVIALLDLGGQSLQSHRPSADDRTVPLISTRGHLVDGRIAKGHSAYDYSLSNFPKGFPQPIGAPKEVLVVVHGFSNSGDQALSRFGIARASLVKNDYKGLVVGFTWDANTGGELENLSGYRRAKLNAKLNGPKLAQFIFDVRTAWPDCKVRLIGYSMGARISLEALEALATDPRFATARWKVESVHLLGAAVRNDEVEVGTPYGQAIERKATAVYNYYSRKDDMLRHYFPLFERDRALGQVNIERLDRAPPNFASRDVSAELPTVSDDGEILARREYGENHGAYLGSRNRRGTLTDDGPINVLVDDIRSTRLAH